MTGLIYISDRQLAGELSRVEWSRGTTNCELLQGHGRIESYQHKKIHHTEWYSGKPIILKPATTSRAFSLRSNRCAARPEGLVGSCVPGQGHGRIESYQYKKIHYTEWYGGKPIILKLATTSRAFSLRSNRCATRSKLLGGPCVPGQGLSG